MYQALCVRSREKRPQPTCKKHRNKDPIKEKILESMSSASREGYLKNKKKDAKIRRNERKAANIRAHKLRLEESRRIGKKHTRKKVHKKILQTMRQIACSKKAQPNKETIARRRANAKQRLVKRRIKKIYAFALRNGADPIKLIAFMVSDMGAKHLPVSKYQKMALAS